MKFFHGGVKNLKIGDHILPAATTGKSNVRDCVSNADVEAGHCRADRVYITTDLNAAKCYASSMPFGDVYVVEPIGDTQPDIDAPEISFHCEKAVVTSIVQRKVSFKMRRIARMINL